MSPRKARYIAGLCRVVLCCVVLYWTGLYYTELHCTVFGIVILCCIDVKHCICCTVLQYIASATTSLYHYITVLYRIMTYDIMEHDAMCLEGLHATLKHVSIYLHDTSRQTRLHYLHSLDLN